MKAYEEGNPTSRICIVGEAPSHMEVKLDRPFVGPAGGVLNDCLRQANIPRAACYITNVFNDRVVKKEMGDGTIYNTCGDVLFSPRKGFTELGYRLAGPCIERLQQCDANVIVPLGGTALQLLFDDSRITKWRGSILESSALPSRKLVSTYHPSWLLRGNMLHQYTVVSDLKRVAAESGTSEINLPQRNLYINPIFPEVIRWLEECATRDSVATDIECLNRHVSCFSVATSPSECMCIPMLGVNGGHRWQEDEEAEIWYLYGQIMGNPNITKINQNIIFDSTFLLQQNNIFTRGPLGDPMVAHHILYPDFPKGLDFLCSNYTREPYYKDDGKLWSKPWVDMEKFWIYNAKDSACAFEIWEAIKPELDDGYWETYNHTIGIFPALTYMMAHGIKIDTGRLAISRERAKEKLAMKEEELRQTAEWDFNPGSPKQTMEYFYVTKGIKPYTSLKTHGPTTDDKTMARIYKRYGLREAKLVQEIRGLRKLISNYLEVSYDADERLRCSYNPRGTTSGRLSSSETIFGTGMNLQNLDTDFKDFLVVDGMEK